MPLTWLEINKKNLFHNIRQFRQIALQSEIWPVVKSNAYGHGMKEVVSVLESSEDVAGFMVASLEEAKTLLLYTQKPIVVLSYFDKEDTFLEEINDNISLPVYDFDTVDFLDSLQKNIKVNIKIDTGTSRLGWRFDEAQKAIEYVKTKKHLTINSIFTHYAESEAEDQTFTKEQLDKFKTITKGYKAHSACSAASIALPEAHGDMIRLGLSLYGLWPSESTRRRGWMNKVCLQPVMSWKTKIVQIRDIKKGETVGYNRTYKFDYDAKIAVLPIGYNEGYNRLSSNKSEVIIKGQKYAIRGNVCMNLCMVEIPADSDIEVGEEVILLGEAGGKNITADDLAHDTQTINYEVVTRINSYLPRVIV